MTVMVLPIHKERTYLLRIREPATGGENKHFVNYNLVLIDYPLMIVTTVINIVTSHLSKRLIRRNEGLI